MFDWLLFHFLGVRNSQKQNNISSSARENEFRNFMHSILSDEGKLARKIIVANI